MAAVTRSTELTKIKKIREKLLKDYDSISKGFEESADRINNTMDYWSIFNCQLDGHQFYSGNTKAYAPIVHDAIEARKTRFVNQIFPQSGRYVEVVTDQEELPEAQLALIDHYVEFARLREQVLPALMKAGDVEGQWNLYIDWTERKRYVTVKRRRGPEVDGMQLGADDVGEEDQFEDVEEQEVVDFGPRVEVLPDSDVLIYPMIADSVDEALYLYGGSVTILRRWSEAMVQEKIDAGEIEKEAGNELLAQLKQGGAKVNDGSNDTKKDHVDAAGVKSGGKYALIYETWKVLKVEERHRLCRVYYGSDKIILSCRINPFWCDMVPLISVPVDKVNGSAKGISKVEPVAPLQYMANDYLNQGADSASYSLLPIIMTDPVSNPKTGSMVIDLAAVWQCDPDKTKFAEFPKMWEDSLQLVEALTEKIFRTLSVNPSMIAQRQSKKPSQAEIAAEQSVDILSTADVIIPLEAGVLTPMVQRFIAYDAQFRKDELWVRAFGREGQKSQMQAVPPQQMGNRVWFKWYGAEQARTAQQMQQQISFANVLMKIPPQMLKGRTLDMTPLIERACESIYGPHLAPKVFKPISDEIGMPPEEENKLLAQNVDLPVAAVDDDRQHLQEHSKLPKGQARDAHMWKHQQQMALKNQAHAAQAQQGGGGGPKPGGMVRPPTGGQQPAGALRPGQMAGGMPMQGAANG